MQQHPGVFDLVVFGLVTVLGVKLAALLGPTIIVTIGWMFGVVAAVWLRKVDYTFWPFVFATLGAALLSAVPVSVFIAPKVGIDAASLLGPIGFAVPFAGDLALKWLKSMLPKWLAKRGDAQ